MYKGGTWLVHVNLDIIIYEEAVVEDMINEIVMSYVGGLLIMQICPTDVLDGLINCTDTV